MQSLNINQYLKVKNNHRPLLFNSVLWSLIFTTLLVVFTKGTTPIKVDFAFTVTFLCFLAFPVLFNFYVLIPRFLKLERYVIYIFLFLFNWLLFSLIIDIGLHPVLDTLFPNLFFISYPSGFNIYIITSVVLVATTLLKLAEDWFYFNNNENKILKLRRNEAETQLSVLRAQINPHFLFNSLNVIYALALEEDKKITNSIVQLSDILRYVLYEADVDRVPLNKEVDLLKNYIEFQKIRNRDQHEVEFLIAIENQSFGIYPMLLLPLVENAYKHGDIIANKDSGFISIDIKQKGKDFSFRIKNSFSKHKKDSITESSGIGLENIKSNLKLVYPESHQIIIENSTNIFSVEIVLSDIS